MTNNQTGEILVQTHQIIAIGGGLNYIDDSTGTPIWRESQDVIELTDAGAAALRMPNRIFFDAELSANTGIKIITRSNLVFSTVPTGIYLYNPATGKEILLAALQTGVAGKLLPPNTVLYGSAFHADGILDADLRITVTHNAIECDTIITHLGSKVSPQNFAMDPSTTLLQVRHAWLTPILPEVGKITVAGLDDATIDFGDILFAQGRAFAWDGGPIDTNSPAQTNPPDGSEEPVIKMWQNGSPSVLIESVRWADVQAKLAKLPLMAKAERGSATKRAKRIELASTRSEKPGFVIDWVILSGGGNYTFTNYIAASTNTYWLQNNITFNGTATFSNNCIIKRKAGTTLTLAPNSGSSIVCYGTCGAPSILTVEGDNMYGEGFGAKCASTDTAAALVVTVRGVNLCASDHFVRGI